MRMHRSLSALAILCAAATAWAPRIATAQTGPTTPNAPWSPPVTPALNQPAPPGYAPPSYAPLRPEAATARPLIPMPQSQWPAEDPSDSKLAAGIALFALSGLTLAHGGVLLAESPPTGCQSYDVYGPSSNCDDQGMGVAGVALVATGASMAAFSTAILTASEGDDRHYPRHSDGMMGAGIVITGVAASGIVGASAMWFYSAYESADYLLAAPAMLLMSGGLVGAGLPLWIKGARNPRAEDMVLGTETEVRGSPAMLLGGAGMTVAGTAIIATGIGIGVEIDNRDTLASRGVNGNSEIITMGGVLAGGTLIATGIPLLVKGARRVPRSKAYASSTPLPFASDPVPEVKVSPGGAAVEWTF